MSRKVRRRLSTSLPLLPFSHTVIFSLSRSPLKTQMSRDLTRCDASLDPVTILQLRFHDDAAMHSYLTLTHVAPR